MDEVILWTEMFPSQMADIQRWKNTPVEQLNPGALQFINAIKDVLPINFEFNEENPATLPFPVLADKDHSFSTKLKLFSTAWDGFYNEQNEPIIFILDKCFYWLTLIRSLIYLEPHQRDQGAGVLHYTRSSVFRNYVFSFLMLIFFVDF